jgi:hypothetical protein
MTAAEVNEFFASRGLPQRVVDDAPAPAGLDAAKSRMRAAVYGDGDVPKWFDDCIEGIVRAATRPAEDAGA